MEGSEMGGARGLGREDGGAPWRGARREVHGRGREDGGERDGGLAEKMAHGLFSSDGRQLWPPA